MLVADLRKMLRRAGTRKVFVLSTIDCADGRRIDFWRVIGGRPLTEAISDLERGADIPVLDADGVVFVGGTPTADVLAKFKKGEAP